MKIVVCKLLTGETVVTKIEYKEDGKIILHNPLQPHVQRVPAIEASEGVEAKAEGIKFALVPLDTVFFMAKANNSSIELQDKLHLVWVLPVDNFNKIEETYLTMCDIKSEEK